VVSAGVMFLLDFADIEKFKRVDTAVTLQFMGY
jgi:hypothetical protein